jgi:hypothetical protein
MGIGTNPRIAEPSRLFHLNLKNRLTFALLRPFQGSIESIIYNPFIPAKAGTQFCPGIAALERPGFPLSRERAEEGEVQFTILKR